MRATITARHVASHANVAISTVGRALADDARISPQTKALVLKAAAELGYVRSLPARMMRGASSRLVGLVVPNIRNDFFAGIAEALSRCCESRDHRLALCVTEDDPDVEARQVRELIEARAAGIFFVPGATPRSRTIADLKAVPHVQILRHSARLNGPWFGIDDAGCIANAVQHLAALGHTRIAYIGGGDGLSTGAERLTGYRQACKRLRVSTQASLVETGGTGATFGAQAASRLLALKRPPTAIVCGATDLTLGVIAALQEANCRIPDDISLVSFGDPAWAPFCGPGLTAIRFSIDELATSCGHWFLDRLESASPPAAQPASQVVSALVVRGSTAPPAAAGRATDGLPRASRSRPAAKPKT